MEKHFKSFDEFEQIEEGIFSDVKDRIDNYKKDYTEKYYGDINKSKIRKIVSLDDVPSGYRDDNTVNFTKLMIQLIESFGRIKVVDIEKDVWPSPGYRDNIMGGNFYNYLFYCRFKDTNNTLRNINIRVTGVETIDNDDHSTYLGRVKFIDEETAIVVKREFNLDNRLFRVDENPETSGKMVSVFFLALTKEFHDGYHEFMSKVDLGSNNTKHLMESISISNYTMFYRDIIDLHKFYNEGNNKNDKK
jgi:hypothetical protein